MTDAAEIGLIGVGALGLAVAQRLLAAGYPVRGYRRSSLDTFVALGGQAAGAATDVASVARTIILLLPNDASLRDVVSEIRPVLRAEHNVLCLGTHDLEAKRAAAEVVADAGAILIDGEVSGTPDMVRRGEAIVMVAGDEAAVAATRPVLAAFSKAVHYVGGFGAAAKMKLVTNYLVGVHTAAAAEALSLGEALGLDAQAIVDVVAGSAGGSTMLAVRGRTMVAQDFAGHPMRGFLRFFDLLRAALPSDMVAHAPLLDLTNDLFRRAIADGYGELDIAAIRASYAVRCAGRTPASFEARS